jgi:hypothetical protein
MVWCLFVLALSVPVFLGPMYQQELWLLGDHTLADLKDRIRCPVDFNIVGKQQAGTSFL